MQITVPDYAGGSLVNLISEIEHRLIGSAPSPRLHPNLAEYIPDSDTYVLCLFDGLGGFARFADDVEERALEAWIGLPTWMFGSPNTT